MKPALLVLAAGMGSRYGGIKQIDPVGFHNETLLDYSTYDAIKSGFGKVVYIIRPDIEKDFRERIFDRVAKNIDAEYVFQTKQSLLSPEQISKSEQREKPWGTVHALLCAKDAIKEPFAVINADDYYGRKAYEILGTYLSGLDVSSKNHAMVGYVLKNTMSLKGSVSRGICQVRDGYLVNMVENTKIEYQGEKIVSHMPEKDFQLTGDEIVSMNFFGFAPSAFEYMYGYWERFIKDNVSEPKKEVFLPSCAGEMVSTGNATMKVFSSPERWFGMTYQEDRDTVKKNLAAKTAEGFYPEVLWPEN